MYQCQDCGKMLNEFSGYCSNCGSVQVVFCSGDPNIKMSWRKPPTKKTPCKGCNSSSGCGGGNKKCDDCSCDECDCEKKYRCSRCGGIWSDKTAGSCGFCGNTKREKMPCNCKKDSNCNNGGCGNCKH